MFGEYIYGGGRMMPQRFETQYQCFSTAFAGRAGLEEGDKILLPPSALDTLARMNVEYPMLFELRNDAYGKHTHCGVLEFSAEEGRCYVPFWMMQNMLLEEGQLITVKNVSLSKATFVKFRAQSVDFLDISNPRAVLEVTLRKFTCLTLGDTICFTHSGKKFFLDVMEVEPNGAASIIETDCNVDFDEPLGYKESEYGRKEAAAKAAIESGKNGGSGGASAGGAVRTLQKAKAISEEEENANKFKAFSGNAQRIDGRLTASAKESKSDDIASAKASGKSLSGSASTSASASASLSAAAPAPPVPAPAPPVVPTYQTRIGDKFSKKKAAIAAIVDTTSKFGGSAYKLGGK